MARTDPIIRTEVGQGVELPPESLFYAPWRNVPALPRPETAPFDPADCLHRLGRVRSVDYGTPDWEPAHIAPTLTRQEADFWLYALVKWCEGRTIQELVPAMRGIEFTGDVALPAARELFRQPRRPPPVEMAGVLANLLGPVEFLTRLAASEFQQGPIHYWLRGQNELALVRGAWERVRPYLTPAELDQVREATRPRLDPARWPRKFDDPLPTAYYVAALAGMHEEVWQLVRTWQFAPGDPARHVLHNSQPLLILLGLRDPAQLVFVARNQAIPLHTVPDLRAWLAHVGIEGLDYAAGEVERMRWGNQKLIEELGRVKDPALAPHMLGLRLRGKHPAPARAWLEENVGSAVVGLLALVGGRDRMGRGATEYFRDLIERGYGEVIEREIATADPALAAKVRRSVLDRPRREIPPLEPAAEPVWLSTAVGAVPSASIPGWLDPATLPPIVVDGRRLTVAHVTALLKELKGIPAGNLAPLAASVRSHAEPVSRDVFAVELFTRWLAEKSPPGDSWVIPALGRLGGDASAATLAPRLRRWPGGASSRRVREALAALRAIGSDYALAQLAQLAADHPNRRARETAAEELAAAAAERGLGPEQLEDRSLPDLGLLAGGIVFDYGPRQFRLGLGPDLRPVAQDEKGKRYSTLPTPRTSDDPVRVAEARDAFRRVKGQAAEVVSVVCRRLERALVEQRRWVEDDFDRFLVRHPIAGAVARRLIWGWFGVDGSLSGTFRVTAEGEYADADDRPAQGNAFQVGLIHPVQLAAEQRLAWAERLADYELIPPFPQLTRPVYDLLPDEATAPIATRFNAGQIPWMVVYRSVKEHAWMHGGSDLLVRTFPAAGLTAVVTVTGWNQREVKGCLFLPRIDPHAGFAAAEALPLGQVDPVVRCEVFADLDRWAQAASQPG